MTTEPTTSRHNPMKVIFNYQNVFFSFFYDDADACVHRSREYAMNYVLSGEMVLDDGHRQIHVGKGECVFIPRDHRVTMYKKASGGEQYCGIYMCFTRSFLREMYGKYARHTDKAEPVEKFVPGVMKLPPSAEIESLFASMTPYFNPEVKPQDDVMQLKLQEGLLALLHTDKRFMTALFDFSTPWKMDILDFMNENYMYEFTLEELAARLQEGERADTREMADSQASGSGLSPAEGRTAESGRCLCGGGLQESLSLLYGLQETLRHPAHGIGCPLVHLNFSEMIFEPHRNVSVGLLCYFCLRTIIE